MRGKLSELPELDSFFQGFNLRPFVWHFTEFANRTDNKEMYAMILVRFPDQNLVVFVPFHNAAG
ncbi:MAG: hypothetical protein DA330_08280, partial [Nitrososphaera sp.]|nr:hypothetical protein [Nitrososphaera sp.]